MVESVFNEIIASLVVATISAMIIYLYRQSFAKKIKSWILRRMNIGVVNIYRHRQDAQPTIDDFVQSARTIWFMGIKATSLLSEHQTVDIDFAQVSKMKILVIDSKSRHVARRTGEVDHKPEIHRPEIQHNLKKFTVLNEPPRISIAVRLYDFLPIWNLLFIDNVLFLSFYLRGIRGTESLCLQIERPSQLFLAFERYFNEMWERAKPAV